MFTIPWMTSLSFRAFLIFAGSTCGTETSQFNTQKLAAALAIKSRRVTEGLTDFKESDMRPHEIFASAGERRDLATVEWKGIAHDEIDCSKAVWTGRFPQRHPKPVTVRDKNR